MFGVPYGLEEVPACIFFFFEDEVCNAINSISYQQMLNYFFFQ